ncbi:MAG: hypothetical protein JJU29_17050 [Verrucomicrobia bacterium]|nr:hypothetical protein [Verrucomicrobiota bacterium]MCH8513869.1 hypothetical protein [Kiritimatiellia bacterium]
MKIRTFLQVFLLAAFMAAPIARAYSPPSDRQISQMLANPGMIRAILGDANGAQAADLMVRVLEKIAANDMTQAQKNYLASFYSARVTFLLGNQATAFAESLIPRVPESLLNAVLAGMSVGGRGSAVFMANLRELVEGDAALQAINSPHIALSEPVHHLLLESLGQSQSLPPVVTDSLPPPIPVGVADPTPGPAPTPTPTPRPQPPIPEPYAGQG